MKIKTSELIGAALDWAVAEALEIDYFQPDTGPSQPEFSTDWSQGGPIIELMGISTFHSPYLRDCDRWKASLAPDEAEPHYYFQYFGHTPLIAAMRCFVAFKLGSEVEIPKELV